MSKRPCWYPQIVDAEYLQILRDDYPEDAHLDDEDLRERFDCSRKYSDAWDHLGDARSDYEPLCDAFLALEKAATAIKDDAGIVTPAGRFPISGEVLLNLFSALSALYPPEVVE